MAFINFTVTTFSLPYIVTKTFIKYTYSYLYMSISNITTIKLYKETKERLDKLKVHPKESYDEILQKILYILNLCKSGSKEARARLLAIDKVKALNAAKVRKN